MSILTEKLKELKLSAEVYELPTEETEPALESKSSKPIENSLKALDELPKILLKDDEFVSKKIKTFLNAYFRENKSEINFEMACWMLIHASCSSDIFYELDDYLNEIEQQNELLNEKYAADSNFFKLASQYLHTDLTLQHERLKKLAYFEGLVELARHGNQSIIDYTQPLSTKPAILEKIFDASNIYVQLSKLDGLYTILLTDKTNNLDISRYIDELVHMVKNKYHQVYHEYKLSHGVDDILKYTEEHSFYKEAIVGISYTTQALKPFSKTMLTDDQEVQDDKPSCSRLVISGR